MQIYNVDSDQSVEQLWETHSFGVEGMTGLGCEKIVHRALKRVNGVKEVSADQESASITVTFDTTKTDVPALHDALLKSGYKPSPTIPAEI